MTTRGAGNDDVVMQARCLYCGAEHYAPAVDAISRGDDACGSCGRTPQVFYDPETYRAARRSAVAFRDAPRVDVDQALLANLQHWARNSQDEQDDR